MFLYLIMKTTPSFSQQLAESKNLKWLFNQRLEQTFLVLSFVYRILNVVEQIRTLFVNLRDNDYCQLSIKVVKTFKNKNRLNKQLFITRMILE